MTDCQLLYSIDQGVEAITFSRPEKLNASTPAMLGEVFKLVA
ncbi:hypothetical protein [Altererythrobacter sp. MF3-039]